MKRKSIFLSVLCLFILICLTACGGNENTTISVSETTNQTTTQFITSSSDITTNEDSAEIASHKSAALLKLDELMNQVISKIADEDLKKSIQTYYDAEKQYVNSITDLEAAKAALAKVVDDTKAFAINSLKPLAIQKLNSVINPLIEKITYNELKNSVQDFYDDEMTKLNAVESLSDIADTFNEILDDTKEFIKDETEKVIIALKSKALEELDPFVSTLINKIPYDSLRADTQDFYNEEKKKLDEVDSFEGFEPCIIEIKDDLEEFVLVEAKKIAVSKLQEVVEAGIAKIPSQELKEDLTDFSEEEIAKLNAVETIEDVPTTLATIVTETEKHIKDLLASTVKDYLARLTEVETTTAYDYLPKAMNPTYSSNIVTASSIDYDFASFTNVSSINKAGYGEQWQMVVENINQSIAMAKVFDVAQTALSAAANAVDIYITNSYADEMSYSFEGTNYTGKFEFADSILVFDISFTSDILVPIFGSLKPVIRMEYDLEENARGMYISLGDSYKVKYVIAENAYEMATIYGITVAEKRVSRSSYLSITQNGGKTIGHIYEYSTYEESDMIKACADFYVENGYVSVVGDKSSGMLGFDGYINELYSSSEGRMLGYEVREELTNIETYNTLWFNLWDIQGINSVKVTDWTDANKSGKSTVDVYLNGSSSLLVPTYNTKLGFKTSRKYDIEYRTRYYYTYDSENEEYVANKTEVPMMFIQEGENFESFASDILKDNSISASVSLSSTYLNKILSDYDTLIDVFIENKDAMSSEAIVAYLAKYEK